MKHLASNILLVVGLIAIPVRAQGIERRVTNLEDQVEKLKDQSDRLC